MVLYVTASTTAGEVDVNLEQGGTVYDLRKISADPPYQLDFTKYAGNWYYAIGDNVSNKIYIYENPVSELQGQPGQPIVPVYIMKIAEANYLAFLAIPSLLWLKTAIILQSMMPKRQGLCLYSDSAAGGLPSTLPGWMGQIDAD